MCERKRGREREREREGERGRERERERERERKRGRERLQVKCAFPSHTHTSHTHPHTHTYTHTHTQPLRVCPETGSKETTKEERGRTKEERARAGAPARMREMNPRRSREFGMIAGSLQPHVKCWDCRYWDKRDLVQSKFCFCKNNKRIIIIMIKETYN